MSGTSTPASISAEYFDGRSARAHAVQLSLVGNDLHIVGAGADRSVPARTVQWPERTRHGPRVAHLKDGGSLHCAQADEWDAWVRAAGRKDSLVVHAQQSWRWVLASVVALGVVFSSLYLWGVPWLGQAAVAATPLSVDRAIGESAVQALDGDLLKPSNLPMAEQQRLQAAFDCAVAALPAGTAPAHRLLFRSSRIGPNAFALPGGTMVLTDALVDLVRADEAVIVGVLGHELGHVQHRDGLRLLVQAGVVAALSSVVLGDFSGLLAGAPVVLGQASYARDAEREADAYAVKVLKAAGISPAVMVGFFEKLAAQRGPRSPPEDRQRTPGAEPAPESPSGDGAAGSATRRKDRSPSLGIAIASHPADEERMRFFRDAAER